MKFFLPQLMIASMRKYMAVSIDLSSIAEHLFVITVNRNQIEHSGTKFEQVCLFI